jgi:ring-1,2-phenylacetyl-CoA epoxidase subunit PaaE
MPAANTESVNFTVLEKQDQHTGNLYKTLIIDRIVEEADGFKTFIFREGHGIRWQAGQFLTFVQARGADEIRRSYSISSAPGLHEPLAIGVKRIPNGFFSRKLVDTASPGDPLHTTGASGFFCLPENMQEVQHILFFAAGSGITPIYPMIKTVLHLHPQTQVQLVYSNQSADSTVFYQAIRQLQSQFGNTFRAHFLFSSMADLKRARLNRELLLGLLAAGAYDRDKTFFYICGPAAYMRMITYYLQEQGFRPDHIRKEDFDPKRSAMPRALPPDTGAHWVTLKTAARTYRLRVEYPNSILEAAKKEKIPLPYSCETGKCGSCAAQCLEGQVWLSRNEVLTEKELASGLTLTCTGHPIQGDAVLQIGPNI